MLFVVALVESAVHPQIGVVLESVMVLEISVVSALVGLVIYWMI